MQDQPRKKEGRSYSLQRGPEGNGHRRRFGGVAGRPDHQQGGLAGWQTFKSGYLRSGSHETATILVFHNVELRRELRSLKKDVVAFRILASGLRFRMSASSGI